MTNALFFLAGFLWGVCATGLYAMVDARQRARRKRHERRDGIEIPRPERMPIKQEPYRFDPTTIGRAMDGIHRYH